MAAALFRAEGLARLAVPHSGANRDRTRREQRRAGQQFHYHWCQPAWRRHRRGRADGGVPRGERPPHGTLRSPPEAALDGSCAGAFRAPFHARAPTGAAMKVRVLKVGGFRAFGELFFLYSSDTQVTQYLVSLYGYT